MHFSKNNARTKGLQGSIIALAGPFANCLFVLLTIASSQFVCFRDEYLMQLAAAHFAMLLINLLPALPLDGGQIVFCIGYYIFNVSSLIALLTALGAVTGAALVLISIYGLFKLKTLNCSLLLIGIYLIKHAYDHQHILRSENLYLIVRERMTAPRKTQPVRLFDVAPDMPLHMLLMYMNDKSSSVFLYRKDGKLSLISEQQVCTAIMQNPHRAFSSLNSAL